MHWHELEDSRDIVERIMSAHWDVVVCPCWVCVAGRRMGLGAREHWLNHKHGQAYPVPASGWAVAKEQSDV